MESLIFLIETNNGILKARACTHGRIQRGYYSQEEIASPTASTDSILLTGTIEAKQRHDILTAKVPSVFVQTQIPNKEEERIVMQIRGTFVKVLVNIVPNTYLRREDKKYSAKK